MDKTSLSNYLIAISHSSRRGNICCFSSSLPDIQGSKESLQVKEIFTYIFSTLVQCTQCSQCGLADIGESNQQLGDGLMEYLRSIHRGNHAICHFTSPSHSPSDVSVLASWVVTRPKADTDIGRPGVNHPSSMQLTKKRKGNIKSLPLVKDRKLPRLISSQ